MAQPSDHWSEQDEIDRLTLENRNLRDQQAALVDCLFDLTDGEECVRLQRNRGPECAQRSHEPICGFCQAKRILADLGPAAEEWRREQQRKVLRFQVEECFITDTAANNFAKDLGLMPLFEVEHGPFAKEAPSDEH